MGWRWARRWEVARGLAMGESASVSVSVSVCLVKGDGPHQGTGNDGWMDGWQDGRMAAAPGQQQNGAYLVKHPLAPQPRANHSALSKAQHLE